MTDLSLPTYWVHVYLSGPIGVVQQCLRQECFREGLCVTVSPTHFIYTGGEEAGVVVALINYPKFPVETDVVWCRAVDIARRLMDATYQDSVLIQSPNTTRWLSRRTEGR